MDDNEYNQLAKQLEKQLNDKNTLVRFAVPGAWSYNEIKSNDPFNEDVPLVSFIILIKTTIKGRVLVGQREISTQDLTDSTMDVIVERIISESARNIARMILEPDSANVPTIQESIRQAASTLPGIS